MPNYRNKNRNRNKNKQRNKQQKQQEQQQQKHEKPKKEILKKESAEPSSVPRNTNGDETQASPYPIACEVTTNSIAICSEKYVTDVVNETAETDKSNESAVCENVQALEKVLDVNNSASSATATGTATEPKTKPKATVTTTESNDTVLNEPSPSDNKIGNKYGVKASDEMGNEKSKMKGNQMAAHIDAHSANQTAPSTVPTITPTTSAFGKVIVHRIVYEDSNCAKTKSEQTDLGELTASASPETESENSINVSTQEILDEKKELSQQQHKVIIHKIDTPDDSCKMQHDDAKASSQGIKVIVHKVHTQDDDDNIMSEEQEVKVTEDKVDGIYTDESDGKIIAQNVARQENNTQRQEKIKVYDDNASTTLSHIVQPPQECRAKVIVHSVFFEGKDEEPKITSPTMREPTTSVAQPITSEVKIVEISDESLSDLEELRSPVVSEAESSIEYSDDVQIVSDSITDVSASSSSSTASTQKQSRKQKRIALEHHFMPQMLNPRFLDSISEENSELSDNSENPLSRSVSTDSATNCPTEAKVQKLNAKYPKSSLDFSKPHKQQSTNSKKSKGIREELVAVAVAALLQDTPNADESCTTLRSCMSPEAEAAEVVFINSASSSISDLLDSELFENVYTSPPEFNTDTDLNDINTNKPATEHICFESLTSSQTPHITAFTATTPKDQLPEFYPTQKNNYNNNNNNQIINNSKLINNDTPPTPHTPATTFTVSKTRSLAETDANSQSDTILASPSSASSSSLPSTQANDQLVFAQIEEEISSVLSSINEVASQYTITTIPTTTTTLTTTSLLSSSAPSSSSSSFKIHSNLSNTQNLPVTTSTTASTRTLETSCEESFKSIASNSLCAVKNAITPRDFSKDVNMNTVREIVIKNNNASENTVKSNGNNENSATNGYVKLNYNNSNTFYPIPPPRGSPPPPPIPPPPAQEHQQATSHDECDNKLSSAPPSSISAIPLALPLLEKNVNYHNSHTQSTHDISSQDLKCALSLLTSPSATRQASKDSHCSDSTSLSQCTAINLATDHSDKSDSVQASLISDLKNNTIQQSLPPDNSCILSADPKKLRLLCAETLASFPYGDAVLEELATVAQHIGEARAFKAIKTEENMPYPLPNLPHIDELRLSLMAEKSLPDRSKAREKDQSWLGVPTNNDPKVLVCLSPSQRSYIQQKTEPEKPDDLLDAHQKFIERRGYHEYTKEQLQHLEREKLAEQQLLQTAAKMKKLRKSITPPPPQIPPPPVPVKSSETASKAQNLSKRTATTATVTNTQKPVNDINASNNNHEQMPATFNGESNGEENKHRLLSIMQDSTESSAFKQKHSVTSSLSSSSYENNSRQTTNGVSAPANEQVPPATPTFGNDAVNNSHKFIQFPQREATSAMQSVETTLGQMFPTIGASNIFDQQHKRFSNIESSTTEPFCSQIMNTQPKRYSSIETHSYETQKRIENGKVVEDFSTSKHETDTSGDKTDHSSSFPLKTSSFLENESFLPSGKEQYKSPHHTNDQDIMSALNLNKYASEVERKQQATTTKTTTIETSHRFDSREKHGTKTNEEDLTETHNNIPKSATENTYEEFRQHAKTAADAFPTSPALNSATTAPTTAKVTSNGDKTTEAISSNILSESTKTSSNILSESTKTSTTNHERLFKEFDDLSKQLHKELETSKAEREEREKSASMFDLNRIHMRQKQQIEEFNKSRHEHMKELEEEIERSMRARSLKLTKPRAPAMDTVDLQSGRTYEIPIHIENGNYSKPAAAVAAKCASPYEEAPPVPQHPKTYQIPIHIEDYSYANDARFRRSESMCNLSNDTHQQQHTYSRQRAEDDWSKYASDLGSSANIARPFAKEVEICYERRPGGIRAPRLTASTNDLSFNNQHSYDHHNAYNVRRHHAPMLNRAPEQCRPKFGSCSSMIERDPNPKYISTTTRTAVSPAPQSSGFFPLDGCHVREEDMRQRRASLPREIHDQQLKYITSKEEELRTEFERLQSERRRLMGEAQKAQATDAAQAPTSPITATRSLRDHYRATQKLPTLTEDEVFRQQMAEEWLNKVAEREKRRLQNIIKISKIQDDGTASNHKTDMGEEFLNRVKERRHKLAMPADSDWESGAESQPIHRTQLSEAEDAPSVKIIEGEREANLRYLPRHLREFAKFSDHQKEAIPGGHREQHQEEERSEETTDNSVSRAFKKSSMVKTVKTMRAPMLPEKRAHAKCNDDYRNDNDNCNDAVNSHDDDGDHDIDASSTLNTNNVHSFSNASSISPSSSQFLAPLPDSFDEMFGKSPFRSRIFEEFNNYWRNFHNAGNKF